MPVVVSQRFKLRLLETRTAGTRLYRIAAAADLSPSMLSAIVHGYARLQPNDPRVLKIGALIGLRPAECFAPFTHERGDGA